MAAAFEMSDTPKDHPLWSQAAARLEADGLYGPGTCSWNDWDGPNDRLTDDGQRFLDELVGHLGAWQAARTLRISVRDLCLVRLGPVSEALACRAHRRLYRLARDLFDIVWSVVRR